MLIFGSKYLSSGIVVITLAYVCFPLFLSSLVLRVFEFSIEVFMTKVRLLEVV